MKHCKKCGEDKSPTEFHNDKKRKDGKYAYCKPCTLAHRLKYSKAKPEERLKYNRFHKYGATPELITQITIRQSNECAGCKRPFTKTPCLDHCHETGVIRGLLCHSCNRALGLLGDNAETLRNLIEYLRGSELQCRPHDGIGSRQLDASEHRQVPS